MDEMEAESELLTPSELAEIGRIFAYYVSWRERQRSPFNGRAGRKLLRHIDALASRLAAAEAERDALREALERVDECCAAFEDFAYIGPSESLRLLTIVHQHMRKFINSALASALASNPADSRYQALEQALDRVAKEGEG